HACGGEGGELTPSLVIHDGVHVLHADISLKQILASVASRCIGVAPPSNSSTSMCMVFLGAVKPIQLVY
ncbi:hypothetical protein NQ272_28030, partial [Escherichia coli]|nr:hypothetical protein [Escherichia coli]